MAANLPFPHEIKEVTDEEDKIVKKYYKGISFFLAFKLKNLYNFTNNIYLKKTRTL